MAPLHRAPAPEDAAYQTISEAPADVSEARVLARAQHDLLSPVRIIKNLPEWVRDDLEDAGLVVPPVVSQSLDSICHLGQRTERMVRDFLAYERLRYHVPQISRFAPAPRLKTVAERVLAPRGWRLTVSGGPGEFATDAELFDEMVAALLDNAAKHHRAQRGTVRAEIAGRRLAIHDDGPGIPDGSVMRVFQPFEMHQSRDKVEGSGLGLSHVLRAANRTGVRVSIHSTSAGTSVRLDFGEGGV